MSPYGGGWLAGADGLPVVDLGSSVVNSLNAAGGVDRAVARWKAAEARLVFFRLPVVDVAAEYGVVANDSSSATASANVVGLNAAITAAVAAGAVGVTLDLPQGAVYINGLVTAPENFHIRFRGQGMSHTGGTVWGTVLIRRTGYAGEMINVIGTTAVTPHRAFLVLDNLGINGNSEIAPMVRCARSNEVIIGHTRLSNSGAEALVLNQPWNCYIHHSFINSSGNAASDIPVVRIDSATGEEGANWLIFDTVRWEGNNGILIRSTAASGQFSILVKHFACGFEDATAATYPLIEVLRGNAHDFIGCWFMKGRKLTDTRASGPLIRYVGPHNAAAGEKRAHIFMGNTVSFWGDVDVVLEHTEGPLIVDGNTFTGDPITAYYDIKSTVGPEDVILGDANAFEVPAKAIRDSRATRRVKSRRLATGRVILSGVASPTQTGLNESGNAGASGGSGALNAFYFDPNDHPAHTKLRIRLAALVNNVAPTSTFTASLVPVTSPTGGAGAVSVTFGAPVTGSGAAIAAPAANSANQAKAEFTPPAAGFYALALDVTVATMAANSSVDFRATLDAVLP